MDAQDLKHLKSLLLKRRREIFDRIQGLQSDWGALSERDIEIEEEAQKADLSTLFDQLDEMEQKELANIDLALAKMTTAGYGICEKCGSAISLERLNALPAASLCKSCAQQGEKRSGR